MEAGNYMYTVPRGYAHVIPEPRGIGNSEGVNLFFETYHHPDDIYDIIEWIAAQPWCTGKVGVVLMIGGNIPGETRVLSVAIYDYVEALEWGKAHLLSAGMVLFSFLVILGMMIAEKRPGGRRE